MTPCVFFLVPSTLSQGQKCTDKTRHDFKAPSGFTLCARCRALKEIKNPRSETKNWKTNRLNETKMLTRNGKQWWKEEWGGGGEADRERGICLGLWSSITRGSRALGEDGDWETIEFSGNPQSLPKGKGDIRTHQGQTKESIQYCPKSKKNNPKEHNMGFRLLAVWANSQFQYIFHYKHVLCIT